jgi:flavodoxin
MLVTIMKTFIVCFSYHHKNTEKIVSVFAKTLDAEVKMPGEVSPQGFSEYDLVGFGSGISFGKHYKVLIDFADKLPPVIKKKAFIFSTIGQTTKKSKFH